MRFFAPLRMTESDGNLAIVLGGGSRVLEFSHSPGGEGTLPGMDTSSPQPSPAERGEFFGGCWHFAVTLTLTLSLRERGFLWPSPSRENQQVARGMAERETFLPGGNSLSAISLASGQFTPG